MQPRADTTNPDELHATSADHLLTIPEVHALCNLSEKTIRRAIDRGDLRAMKLCNRMRVDPDDLREWLHSALVQPHDATAVTGPSRRPPKRLAGGLRELLD